MFPVPIKLIDKDLENNWLLQIWISNSKKNQLFLRQPNDFNGTTVPVYFIYADNNFICKPTARKIRRC